MGGAEAEPAGAAGATACHGGVAAAPSADTRVLGKEGGGKQHKRYSRATIKQPHADSHGAAREPCFRAAPGLRYWDWRKEEEPSGFEGVQAADSDRICSRRVLAA